MEVMTTTNAAVTTPAAAPTKIPEADIEIPTRIQSNKPAPFANGILKRLHPHSPLPSHHHVSATNTSSLMVSYKECLKNHAASLGGHALDGCGEFMPSPISIPTDPTSLKCAACGCHRNFHRRDPEEQASPTTAVIEYRPHHRHHPPPPLPPPQSVQPSIPQRPRSPGSHSPPPISSSYYPSAPHMLLALSAGAAGLSGPTPAPPQPPPPLDIGGTPSPILQVTPMASITPTNPNGRKRFRTKFSQGQKEKMCQFAERVGWKMQKRDEELVSEFCSEIGVDRGVLKVWMHNNKNTLGKIRDANGNIINNNHSPPDNNNNNNNINMNHENLFHHNNNGSSAHVATNGSSSSS